MTEKWFRDTWGRLARAVLEMAFADLNPGSEGFSGCSFSERKKWKVDAVRFFDTRGHERFAMAAGLSCPDIERAFLARLPAETTERKR